MEEEREREREGEGERERERGREGGREGGRGGDLGLGFVVEADVVDCVQQIALPHTPAHPRRPLQGTQKAGGGGGE